MKIIPQPAARCATAAWRFLSDRQLRKMIWPLAKMIWHYSNDRNDWQASTINVPKRFYGSGCIHDFDWYLEGESRVDVRNLRELCNWLKRCQYISDMEMFRERDFWQHPLTFEKTRKGDCEDHALWAWRKLIRLGHPAELVVGNWLEGDGKHAWVVFHDGSKDYLLESVVKDKIQPSVESWTDRNAIQAIIPARPSLRDNRVVISVLYPAVTGFSNPTSFLPPISCDFLRELSSIFRHVAIVATNLNPNANVNRSRNQLFQRTNKRSDSVSRNENEEKR